MPVNTQASKGWMKSSNNMKLSSDASVFCLTHEGIANFASLCDFDKKIMQHLPKTYKNSIPAINKDVSNSIGTETTISRANTSSILVIRLVTVVNAAKYYGSIARVMNRHDASYLTVIDYFKVEH